MSNSEFGRKAAMRGSVSLLALAAFAYAAPAYAQAEGSMETIVVTGVRASLESAVSIKRNADTVVDSITATDIGVFPDKSVSDAIQRVPGVTVSHLQSDDDTTHPSGEATGVLVRGLTFVRTNFNGRDSFSADGHRGLNVNDVSPEMIGGIDVFKNQTADMLEGGIAGIVNIRTRMPFDNDDHTLAGSVKMNYNDRADDVTYDYSGVGGKNFDTSIGRIGFLLGYANSHVVTQTNSVIGLRNGTFCSAGAANPDGTAIVNSGSIPCTANPYGGSSWAYIPDEVNYSRVNYNRKREGKSAELQWESPNKDLRWNFQYNESNYRNAWLEHSSNINLFGLWGHPGFDPLNTMPVQPAFGTSPFTFNSNGTLRSGTLANGIGSFYMNDNLADTTSRASVVPGLPYVNFCGTGTHCANPNTQGVTLENQSRIFDHSEGTRDLSTNLQWDVTPKLHATFDGQYVSAKTGNNDMLVANDILVDAKYTRDGNGAPTIALTPGDNSNYAPGFLTNPQNYYSAFIQDHKEKNNAQEIALKGDVQWDVDNGWLSYIKAGVRYANRKQVVRYSAYNWQPVANTWLCNGPGFSINATAPASYSGACGTSQFTGYGSNIWYTQSLGNDFFDGKVFNPGATVWLKNSVLSDPNAVAMALGHKETGSPGSWDPICARAGTTDCFLPSEVLDVTEKTTAGYLMVAFGGDSLAVAGFPVSGNIGARYVKTELTSTGGISYPTADWYNNQFVGNNPANAPLTPCSTPVTGNNVTNISCWLTSNLAAFSNGGSGLNSYGKTSYNLLPSFNLRVDLSDNTLLRFAVSEAMSRPDFGYLRNYVGISAPAVDTSSTSAYVTYNSPTAAHTPANVTGYNFVFIANAGNPALKPMTSWQYDATFEHYFSASSSFTADLFLKELNNSIAYGDVARSITNNGATENILVRGPVNSPNGGELWGFEVAYQAFFDFLPSPFDGLGTQLNYIHTHQAGIHNSNLSVQPGYLAGSTIAFGGGLQIDNAIIDSHRLAGISDDSYNIVALYEKGPIGVRFAYNYRSQFLTDNLDCCTGTPMYQKGAGFLDGSIRYSVDDHWEVSLDGSNLLDTTTVFQQQVAGDTSLSPKAKPVILDTGWSKSGRLLQFAIRVKY